MMLKFNQKSLDNQLPEYHRRPHIEEEDKEEEEEDFYIGDVEEDYDYKVPPMFL